MEPLEDPRKLVEQLLRCLEMSSKFSFKNDTEQAKYAKALSIFLDQVDDLEETYMNLKKENK